MSNKKGGKAAYAREFCASLIDSRPDTYNSPFLKTCALEEAKKMGWVHYFDGETMCAGGHVAARYVTNPAICVDCKRLGEGKPPIYSNSTAATSTDDLTSPPTFINPIANANFGWTDEKKSQLLAAWINTGGDMLAATKIVGCQPLHVIDLKRSDPEFQAAYEAASLKVDEVQLWSMTSRATGNDRVGLAMAQSKFTEFGAKSGLADRPTINPEQARAELANILSSLKRSHDQEDRLRATIRANRAVARTDSPATADADTDVEELAVLAPPYDGSDLV